MYIKFLSLTLCFILTSVLLPSIAHAAPIKINLRANTTSGLYNYVQYDQNTCAAMMAPRFKVKHVDSGKIVGTKGSFKLKKGPCKGRKMKGVAFRYTPKRGFRGKVKAAIQLNMPAYTDGSGNASRTLNFVIQVK